jgi:hypothetical protein
MYKSDFKMTPLYVISSYSLSEYSKDMDEVYYEEAIKYLPFDETYLRVVYSNDHADFKLMSNCPNNLEIWVKPSSKNNFRYEDCAIIKADFSKALIEGEEGDEIDVHVSSPNKGNMANFDNEKFSDLVLNMIKPFLLLLGDKQSVQGKGRKIKVRSNGNKTYLRETYVSSKRYISKDSSIPTNIAWTHCFDVCGHWRKVKGIGKNRQGERTVKGYTWISPFEKQKHLEKRVKERIVV